MAVYHLCRICLTESTNTEAMQPLFDDKNDRCEEIVRKIEDCGGIVLKPHEEYPKLICDQCLHLLDTSYKFRAMCQASEHALLDAIVKSELKIEPHDFSHIDGNKSQFDDDESEIFFDLQTEIIDAEEVDLDMLAEKNEIDEESLIDYVQAASDLSSESEYKYIPMLAKKMSNTIPKKRGRPRLKPLDNSSIVRGINSKAGCGSGRKKQTEINDQIMCEICGNIYAKRSMLNMHMRRHMAEKPFECEICSKTFACASEIRRHMRVHTGEKPFICKFCGRTFADRSTNIKHERIHTKERPFTCNTCGKTFTYSNVLKNHLLVHTGEKPFSCIPCNKTFSRKHQLDQHYATLTHQHTMKNITSSMVEIGKNEILMMQPENAINNSLVYKAIHQHTMKNLTSSTVEMGKNEILLMQPEHAINNSLVYKATHQNTLKNLTSSTVEIGKNEIIMMQPENAINNSLVYKATQQHTMKNLTSSPVEIDKSEILLMQPKHAINNSLVYKASSETLHCNN